jgi:hypothetical protein
MGDPSPTEDVTPVVHMGGQRRSESISQPDAVYVQGDSFDSIRGEEVDGGYVSEI